MNKIKITQAQDHTSCNVCWARNYDSSMPHVPGRRVDQLYELEIGRTMITLCEECLKRLGKTISAAQSDSGGRSEEGFYDDAGGYHRAGIGWNPLNHFCGDCPCDDCGQCPQWACDTPSVLNASDE